MSRPQREPSAARQLLALAREAAPPPLASTDARRMVRHALLGGAARHRAQAARRGWLMAAVAASALAAFAAFPQLRGRVLQESSPVASSRAAGTVDGGAAPLSLRLPGRDAMVATPGAQFELLSADLRDRRIRVRAGAVAFEVEPLGREQRFAAVTPHATVSVRGTVFSVQVDARRTRVRVYEGSVVVASAAGERVLRAGESYASDGVAPATQEEIPLHAAARAMARRRQLRAAAQPAAREPAAAEPAAAQAHTAEQPAIAAAVEPPVQPPPLARVGLERARAWLYEGHAERALRAARERGETDVDRGPWLLLAGDALRSLGRHAEAARAFGEAVPRLAAAERVQAGFKAADIHLRVLRDARAALHALDTAAADAPRSPLRERGLLLRIEARQSLGEDVTGLARMYLAEYPASAGASRMRGLLAR